MVSMAFCDPSKCHRKWTNQLIDTIPRPMLQRYESNLQASPAVVVGVAQLVERQTVDLDVAGSNPVTHPICGGTTALTFNHPK